MNQSITLGQLWLAIAFPTIFSVGSLAVAVVGIMTNNGRFNTIDGRLLRIETSLDDMAQRLVKVEERLDSRLVKP